MKPIGQTNANRMSSMAFTGAVPVFLEQERWCAAGDSLTQGGLYHQFVQLYYATRFPERRLEVMNCGTNGDTTARLSARLDQDVLNHAPTLVSILLGGNDISQSFPSDATESHIREQRAKAVAVYRDGLRSILERLRQAGVRSLLVTPGLYDETLVHPKARAPNRGIQATLLDCGAVVRALAAEFAAPVIDWTQPLMDWNAQLQKADPSATLIGLDRWHPGETGSFVMAYEFLKALDAPRDVSRIVIEAATGHVREQQGCNLSQIIMGADAIAFACQENSLPFPIPETCRSGLAFLPFIERFNLELLQVEGLRPGPYQVRIDGIQIRVYTAEQLQAGINLALESSTPQYRQARMVEELVARRADIQRTLRCFVEMEFFIRDVDLADCSMTTIQEILNARIRKFKDEHGMDDSWFEFIAGQARRYIESKPHERTYRAEVDLLMEQIDRINKPMPHHFEIALTI